MPGNGQERGLGSRVITSFSDFVFTHRVCVQMDFVGANSMAMLTWPCSFQVFVLTCFKGPYGPHEEGINTAGEEEEEKGGKGGATLDLTGGNRKS